MSEFNTEEVVSDDPKHYDDSAKTPEAYEFEKGDDFDSMSEAGYLVVTGRGYCDRDTRVSAYNAGYFVRATTGDAPGWVASRR